MEMIICEEFKILEKIRNCKTCEIFQGINIKNGKKLAIKVQTTPINQQESNSPLYHQSKIHKKLSQDLQILDNGIPNFYYFGKQANKSYLILDLMGMNTAQLLLKCSTFRIKTLVMIADQMTKRLQYLHGKGFVHHDVRPENFVMGLGEYRKKLYMIDFDYSKRFLAKDGSHMAYNQNKKQNGNLLFSSINSQLGIQASRRDDLESMLYCWYYFFYGYLPWSNIDCKHKQEKNDKVLSKKIENRPSMLFKNMDQQFRDIHQHVLNLGFDQKPNYQLIRCKLQDVQSRNGFDYDFRYEWDQIDEDSSEFQLNKLITNV